MQFGEDRCTQFRVRYRGNRPTNTPTKTHTNPQTGPITIHCAAASLARSVNNLFRQVKDTSVNIVFRARIHERLDGLCISGQTAYQSEEKRVVISEFVYYAPPL